jgi:hypothetical protein
MEFSFRCAQGSRHLRKLEAASQVLSKEQDMKRIIKLGEYKSAAGGCSAKGSDAHSCT